MSLIDFIIEFFGKEKEDLGKIDLKKVESIINGCESSSDDTELDYNTMVIAINETARALGIPVTAKEEAPTVISELRGNASSKREKIVLFRAASDKKIAGLEFRIESIKRTTAIETMLLETQAQSYDNRAEQISKIKDLFP